MAISLYIIKKYVKVLAGKNDMTVNQDEGKCYSKTAVEGYYNNLTEKITKFGFPGNQIPIVEPAPGVKMEFSIAVFQYGIAAYDLYLQTKGQSYLSKLKACADWAIDHQEANGAWATFTYKRPDQLYSAMAQGEGISMLIRAHIAIGDSKYLDAAKAAKIFMMKPINDGGTSLYHEGKIYLYEYLHAPQVLNGWIFAAWGLYDYAKFFEDQIALSEWNNTVSAMVEKLPLYDNGFWSKYSDGRSVANPFYHKLHIALLNTMYDLTGIDTFKKYAELFQAYQNKRLNKTRAIIYKFWLKLLE